VRHDPSPFVVFAFGRLQSSLPKALLFSEDVSSGRYFVLLRSF
jgi:hypothetical protein